MKGWIKGVFMMALTLITSQRAHADILKIDSVEGLVSYMENIKDTSTLAIFDVDMVLLIPQESYFRMPILKRYYALYKSMTSSLTGVQKDMMLMYILIDSPLVPLDDKMVSLIQSLQNKGVPTIAFTSALTGSMDRIANMTAWRIFSLEYAGYHFANSFPYLTHSTTFNNFPKYIGSYPFFNQGVLFANEGYHGPVKKGKVLVHFLNYAYKTSHQAANLPKRIIMIDDRKENLEDIAACLQEAFPQIEFIPIHFTAAEHVAVTHISETGFKSKMQEIITQVRHNEEAQLRLTCD